MYSLVSSPVLGFDLVRRAGGSDAAAVVAAALDLSPADLPALAAALRPEDQRASAWASVTRATEDSVTLRALVDRTRTLPSGPGTIAALRSLETTTIGGLEDLLRCVRHDVFDWTWRSGSQLAVQDEASARGVSAVCDAVAATYAGPALSTRERETLLEGWRSAGPRTLPRDLGPGSAAVHRLLFRVRTLLPADRDALRTASETYRKGSSPWALAVHNASWAAHLSDRTRAAAQAQMLLVMAAQAGGLQAADCAGGTWNLLSGAVHAIVVRDLLADADVHALVGPVAAVLGPLT